MGRRSGQDRLPHVRPPCHDGALRVERTPVAGTRSLRTLHNAFPADAPLRLAADAAGGADRGHLSDRRPSPAPSAGHPPRLPPPSGRVGERPSVIFMYSAPRPALQVTGQRHGQSTSETTSLLTIGRERAAGSGPGGSGWRITGSAAGQRHRGRAGRKDSPQAPAAILRVLHARILGTPRVLLLR